MWHTTESIHQKTTLHIRSNGLLVLKEMGHTWPIWNSIRAQFVQALAFRLLHRSLLVCSFGLFFVSIEFRPLHHLQCLSHCTINIKDQLKAFCFHKWEVHPSTLCNITKNSGFSSQTAVASLTLLKISLSQEIAWGGLSSRVGPYQNPSEQEQEFPLWQEWCDIMHAGKRSPPFRLAPQLLLILYCSYREDWVHCKVRCSPLCM